MPPPPEGAHGVGAVGVVKVLVEPEAEDPPQADGHVGVAGEVEVELESESGHAQPCPSSGELPGGEGQNGIPQLADVVGQQDLFRQAHHEDLHAGGKLLGGVGAVVDLVAQIFVFDDGTGDELGEECDEGAEVDEAALHLGVVPVHVDGVAHGLEGVEGDADGQAQAQLRHEGKTDGLEAAGNEVPVLEKEQQSQIEDDRRGHRPPGPPVVAPALVLLHQHSVGVVDADGEEHDKDIDRLSPGVEHQVDQQQQQVPPFQRRNIVQK